MSSQNKVVRLSRGDFIFPPYFDCPNCKKSSRFGLLEVYDDVYVRECTECSHSVKSGLPSLNKKIIYLDQFVISDMMKAINKSLGKVDKVDPFWRQLFEKLEILRRLQLIICPSSQFHLIESSLSEREPLIRRMYNHLSNGISFRNPETIRRFQISVKFQRWLDNGEGVSEITVQNVVRGKINAWPEPISILSNLRLPEEIVGEARQIRKSVNFDIVKIFHRWQGERGNKFQDWFNEEALSFGKGVIDSFVKRNQYLIGAIKLTDEEILFHKENSELVPYLVRYTYDRKDLGSYLQGIRKVISFLRSDEMLRVSFNRISSLLWAALADRAAHDRTSKAPDEGMGTDIEMVACLLPYCDALFVDKKMFGLLDYGTVKQDIQKHHKTRVFSASSKEKFLEYLDTILKEADSEVVTKAKEVYGEPKPFYAMYDN